MLRFQHRRRRLYLEVWVDLWTSITTCARKRRSALEKKHHQSSLQRAQLLFLLYSLLTSNSYLSLFSQEIITKYL